MYVQFPMDTKHIAEVNRVLRQLPHGATRTDAMAAAASVLVSDSSTDAKVPVMLKYVQKQKPMPASMKDCGKEERIDKDENEEAATDPVPAGISLTPGVRITRSGVIQVMEPGFADSEEGKRVYKESLMGVIGMKSDGTLTPQGVELNAAVEAYNKSMRELSKEPEKVWPTNMPRVPYVSACDREKTITVPSSGQESGLKGLEPKQVRVGHAIYDVYDIKVDGEDEPQMDRFGPPFYADRQWRSYEDWKAAALVLGANLTTNRRGTPLGNSMKVLYEELDGASMWDVVDTAMLEPPSYPGFPMGLNGYVLKSEWENRMMKLGYAREDPDSDDGEEFVSIKKRTGRVTELPRKNFTLNDGKEKSAIQADFEAQMLSMKHQLQLTAPVSSSSTAPTSDTPITSTDLFGHPFFVDGTWRSNEDWERAAKSIGAPVFTNTSDRPIEAGSWIGWAPPKRLRDQRSTPVSGGALYGTITPGGPIDVYMLEPSPNAHCGNTSSTTTTTSSLRPSAKEQWDHWMGHHASILHTPPCPLTSVSSVLDHELLQDPSPQSFGAMTQMRPEDRARTSQTIQIHTAESSGPVYGPSPLEPAGRTPLGSWYRDHSKTNPDGTGPALTVDATPDLPLGRREYDMGIAQIRNAVLQTQALQMMNDLASTRAAYTDQDLYNEMRSEVKPDQTNSAPVHGPSQFTDVGNGLVDDHVKKTIDWKNGCAPNIFGGRAVVQEPRRSLGATSELGYAQTRGGRMDQQFANITNKSVEPGPKPSSGSRKGAKSRPHPSQRKKK